MVDTLKKSKKSKVKVDISQINGIQSQVNEMEVIWSDLLYIDWTSEDCDKMILLAGKILTGSVIKKLPSVAIAADTLSVCISALNEHRDHPTIELKNEIDARIRILNWKIRALKGELEDHEKTQAPASTGDDDKHKIRNLSAKPLIFLFDRDVEYGKNLALQISQNGYEVRIFDRIDSMGLAFKHQSPAAIIADAFFEEPGFDGLEAISSLAAREEGKVPVVFISTRGDYAARHRAWGAGGDAYLMKPVNIPALVGRLDELTMTVDSEPYRVLIVDDDMMVSHFNSQILQMAGMVTCMIHQAPEIMKGLMEFKPDLVLLDLYLDDCNGFDIAELIRQEEAFVNVPIFFLSGEKSHEIQLQALGVGADDFLVKPVDKEWLVCVVRSRIKRGRALGSRLKYMGNRDSVTGLYNRAYFIRRLERLMMDQPSGSLGLIYVTLDHFGEMRGTLGISGIDRLMGDIARIISNASTIEDLVARVEDHGFMILSNRKHWEHFINLAELIQKSIGEYRLEGMRSLIVTSTVSVGLCKKEEPSMIIAELEEIGSEGVRNGGNRVQMAPSLASIAEMQDEHKNNLAQLVENAQAGRVHLAYQPIVSAHGDGVERYEVLFRICNELGEELPVGKLLEAAQNAGMMKKIDMGVLRQAMSSSKKRFDVGRLATLFVKVSLDSLDPDYLVKLVSHDLNHHNLPGEILVFLLPTTGMYKRPAEVGPLIDQLHEMGCHVALEHFGEKSSDLQLLDRFQIDYVKLHPSIVSGLDVKNQAKMNELRSLVEEIQSKNVSSLVGFVEDAGAMTAAWQLGVDLIQGNFVQSAEGHMAFAFMDNI